MSWAEQALAHERRARERERAVALEHACAHLEPAEELAHVVDHDGMGALTRAEDNWQAVRDRLQRLGKITIEGHVIAVGFVERGLR